MNTPTDWDGESHCCRDGCHEPATHANWSAWSATRHWPSWCAATTLGQGQAMTAIEECVPVEQARELGCGAIRQYRSIDRTVVKFREENCGCKPVPETAKLY